LTSRGHSFVGHVLEGPVRFNNVVGPIPVRKLASRRAKRITLGLAAAALLVVGAALIVSGRDGPERELERRLERADAAGDGSPYVLDAAYSRPYDGASEEHGTVDPGTGLVRWWGEDAGDVLVELHGELEYRSLGNGSWVAFRDASMRTPSALLGKTSYHIEALTDRGANGTVPGGRFELTFGAHGRFARLQVTQPHRVTTFQFAAAATGGLSAPAHAPRQGVELTLGDFGYGPPGCEPTTCVRTEVRVGPMRHAVQPSDIVLTAVFGNSVGKATLAPEMAMSNQVWEWIDYDRDGLLSGGDAVALPVESHGGLGPRYYIGPSNVQVYDRWSATVVLDKDISYKAPGAAAGAIIVALGAAAARRRDVL
jgi:hypothetical protein